MKIHIEKEKVEKKGFLGPGKTWFIVTARYELNDEEEQLLEKNKHVLKLTPFDFPFRGPDGDPKGNTTPTIKQLIGDKGFPLGCVFSNGELEEVENMVNQGAKNLKAELYGGGVGSTVTEI
jgi:hypothetical protein